MRRPLRDYLITVLSACLLYSPMLSLKSARAAISDDARSDQQQHKSPPLNS